MQGEAGKNHRYAVQSASLIIRMERGTHCSELISMGIFMIEVPGQSQGAVLELSEVSPQGYLHLPRP